MLRDKCRLRALCAAIIVFAVSCADPAGAAPGRAEQTAGLSLAQADDPNVCCAVRRNYATMTRSACRGAHGRETPAARCRRPRDPIVCCATSRGIFAMAVRACGAAGGRIAAPARCRAAAGPRICCATADGFFTMSRGACESARGRQAPALRCAAQALVCCRLTDPRGRESHRSLSVRECRAEGGRIAAARFCRTGPGRTRPLRGG